MKKYNKTLDSKIYNNEDLPDSGYETAAIVFSAISYILVVAMFVCIASFLASRGFNIVLASIFFLTAVSLVSLLVVISNNIFYCARLKKLRRIARKKNHQDDSPA